MYFRSRIIIAIASACERIHLGIRRGFLIGPAATPFVKPGDLRDHVDPGRMVGDEIVVDLDDRRDRRLWAALRCAAITSERVTIRLVSLPAGWS